MIKEKYLHGIHRKILLYDIASHELGVIIENEASRYVFFSKQLGIKFDKGNFRYRNSC